MTEQPRSESIGDLDDGETVTDSVTKEMPVWDAAPRDWVGYDRQTTNIEASNIRVEGDEGNERLVYELSADVTGVDPKVKPVFQTEERYKHGYGGKTPWWKKAANGAIATLIAGGITAAVGIEVINTISGEAFSGPFVGPAADAASIVGIVLILVAIIGMLPYMPRRFA